MSKVQQKIESLGGVVHLKGKYLRLIGQPFGAWQGPILVKVRRVSAARDR